MFVKICGFTQSEQAEFAVSLGVNAVGLVMAASPRQVSPAQAFRIAKLIPEGVWRVGVFVNASFHDIVTSASIAGIDTLQLHGDEQPSLVRQLVKAGWRVIKALRVRDRSVLTQIRRFEDAGAEACVLDSYVPGLPGGTGSSFNWSIAAEAVRSSLPVILAGGLEPANVESALATVHPFGIDLSSGVESSPGIKDPARMSELMTKVRSLRA